MKSRLTLTSALGALSFCSVTWAQTPPSTTPETPNPTPRRSEVSPSESEQSQDDGPGDTESVDDEAELGPTSPGRTPREEASEKSADENTDGKEEPDTGGTPELTDKNSQNEVPSQEPSEREPQEQQAASKEEKEDKNPYAGLDHSGTPAPPDSESKDPEGEWEDDYDGRPDETHAEDLLIWIPRTPLLPAHLVLDYGVRWPIVKGIALAEEAKLFNRIEDFFTFADGRAGLYPIAFYDRGRGFWAGGNFFFNDLGVKGHSFRATAGAGTNSWYNVGLKDSWDVFESERGILSFELEFSQDPTQVFTGFGHETDIDDTVYYAEEKIEGLVDLRVALSGLNRFTSTVGFKRAEMHGGRSPSIESAASPVDTEDLTGFGETFHLGWAQMKLDLDTRNPKDQYVPGSGVRLETWGSYHYGPGAIEMSFFRYGLNPSFNIDLSGANHMLSFSAHAEALSKTHGDSPPINQLVTLGGTENLRGFLPGRFIGESSLVYSIDYSWPLFAFADAMFFAEAGNAFNGFFDDFSHDELVLDWGTGLRTSFSRELKLFLAVGFGTNQIENYDDFAVESTRVFFGVTRDL